MQQKNLFLAVSMIIAILALGIAYAAITTQTLNITGNITATTSDANFNVNFSGTPTTIKNPNKETIKVTTSVNSKAATMYIAGLDTKGDTVTTTFTIKNDSADIDAKLSNINVDWDNTTWFNVTTTFVEGKVLKPGETTTFEVEVVLKDTPATDAEVEIAKDTFTITFDADAQ